jgi:lysophospholipase L1-like esterase
MYKASLNANPEIVVIQFGTNDAKTYNWNQKRFMSDYVDLIKSYRSLDCKPLVLICIPPPYYSNISWWNIQRNIVNEVLPKVVPEVAEKTGAILVDNFAALGSGKLLHPHMYINSSFPMDTGTNDGLHPHDAGYAAMASNVATVIREHFSAHMRSKKPKRSLRST